jgi:hypothetical protein
VLGQPSDTIQKSSAPKVDQSNHIINEEKNFKGAFTARHWIMKNL